MPLRHNVNRKQHIDQALRPNILDLTFRVNPAFQLVEQADLSPAQNSIFELIAKDPEHFGFLISNELPTLGVLAVNRAGARLFESLREPRDLHADNNDPIEIARLVLDGILEIDWNGQFVTGPSACSVIFVNPFEKLDPVGTLSALSLTALQSIQNTSVDDPRAISSWLYSYNCLPMSPFWAKRFGSPERVETFLGLQIGGSLQSALQGGNYVYKEVPGWRTWQNPTREVPGGLNRPTFKLYISPLPNALPEVLSLAVHCFAGAHVATFKLGRDGFGVLRPDKLVAYFSEYEALEITANELKKMVSGCPAHGVPFTAAITEDGLLSWGMDPPHSERVPGWRGGESWRAWITNILARAVLRANALSDKTIESWHYALLRVRLEGVQIQTWLPSTAMWKD